MSKSNPDVKRHTAWIFFVALLLFVYPVVTQERFVHGGVERLPLYYGTLHDNGYIAAISLLFAIYNFNEFENTLVGYIYIGFALFLLIGYSVRSAELMLVVGLMGVLVYKIPEKIRNVLLLKILLLPIIIMALYLYTFSDAFIKLSVFSSGRIQMWEEQLYRLQSASIEEVIFGFGVNGDLIRSNVWIWEDKGAHSTFLSILVRHGVGGFVLFTLFLYRLYVFLMESGDSKQCMWLYIAFLSTLVVSNGLLERVVPLLLFLILFTFVVNDNPRHERKT